MSRPVSQTTGRYFAAVVFLLFFGNHFFIPQLEYSRQYAAEPSPLADSFSEANAFRASESYIENGVTPHCGLPAVLYGGKFAESGFTVKEPHVWPAYTHYPGGPDLLLGLLRFLTEDHGFGKARAVLVIINSVIVSLGVYFFWKVLGLESALLISLWAILAPAFSRVMHTVHYQGLALSLLFLEVALASCLLRGRLTASKKMLWGLFVIGFLQGSLSFDYVVLVWLSPWVLWALSEAKRPNLKPAILLSTAALLGFCGAHAVHFGQVICYYGSFHVALDDFLRSAVYRSGGVLDGWIEPRLAASRLYLFELVHRQEYFGEKSSIAVALTALLICSRLHSGGIRSAVDVIIASGVALLACLAWVWLMLNHAVAHQHFLPRSFFLLYLVPSLAAAGMLTKHSEPPRFRNYLCIVALGFYGIASFQLGSVNPRQWMSLGGDTYRIVSWMQGWGGA